jgi:hypothetical protein
MNVTVPVGVVPLPLTVAVNVTDCPNVLGFCDDATAIVGAARLTVCENPDELLAR